MAKAPKRGPGRPKVAEEERLIVKPMRFSQTEIDEIQAVAEKIGDPVLGRPPWSAVARGLIREALEARRKGKR